MFLILEIGLFFSVWWWTRTSRTPLGPVPFSFPLPGHVKGGAPKKCCGDFNYAYQECGQCKQALPEMPTNKC